MINIGPFEEQKREIDGASFAELVAIKAGLVKELEEQDREIAESLALSPVIPWREDGRLIYEMQSELLVRCIMRMVEIYGASEGEP